MRIIDSIRQSIAGCCSVNPDVQATPVCILWPDKERQWEPALGKLIAEMPELFVLGAYNPALRTGPAIWLRCIIAGQIKEFPIPGGKTAIIYLPGFGRQDLRNVDNCAVDLKPLVELQYRGAIFSHENGKDWTLTAFLGGKDGGLGLEIAKDNETRNALQSAIGKLMDVELSELTNKRLDHNYFNSLLAGDPVKELLTWLDRGDGYQAAHNPAEWAAFIGLCKSQFGLDPENDGLITAAGKLAGATGAWKPVWNRYCEAPGIYPNIPKRLRQADMPQDVLANAESHGRWPQWNEEQEKSLRTELMGLADLPPQAVRIRIMELEKKHAPRRKLVWARLGFAPLAKAMEHLSCLAERTSSSLAIGTLQEISAGYVSGGWLVDNAAMGALESVEESEDREAVNLVVRALYLPWLQESADHLQSLAKPNGFSIPANQKDVTPGTVVLFVDGLRFDLARRLVERLKERNLPVQEKSYWAALPSVTGTGKYAVSPVAHRLYDAIKLGKEIKAPDTNTSPCSPAQHTQMLEREGFEILGSNETGKERKLGWAEFGNIDHEGHSHTVDLVYHFDDLLKSITNRICSLLNSGWKQIRVVTDHGWLLMPGGLPKSSLAASVSEGKGGRCAILKPGALTSETTFPWHWNKDVHFALADNVRSYWGNSQYAHGGISLQECLLLELIITNTNPTLLGTSGEAQIVWKGLRCTVVDDPSRAGQLLDIRLKPANIGSTIVDSPKPFNGEGTASVIVVEPEYHGQLAFLVILDPDKSIVSQKQIKIGGDHG